MKKKKIGIMLIVILAMLQIFTVASFASIGGKGTAVKVDENNKVITEDTNTKNKNNNTNNTNSKNTSNTTGSTTSGITEYSAQVNKIYKALVRIYMPIAAVSFAVTAFRMIFTVSGGMVNREGIALKQIMRTIIAATILLFTLPYIINAGASIGGNFAWKPPTPQ